MKIGITTFGCDAGRSGIGRYLISLLHQFARLLPRDGVEVLVRPEEEQAFLGDVPGMPRLVDGSIPKSPLRNLLWHQTTLPGLCQERGYDVLFLPAANRRLPVRCPVPMVGTVHDLSSLHVHGKYDMWHHVYIHHGLPRLIRKLTQVVTVSQCSARDIVDYARVPTHKVTVIPNALDHQVYRPQDRAASAEHILARYQVETPYLLYVSRLEHPGKNHVRLIRAFDRLDLPHRLVLAGPAAERADDVYEAARAAGKADRIVFPSFVAQDDLPRLYAAADALIFPSLYEGFGIPVLEAMACGVPVACSNQSSLPEVAGDAAILFNPHSEEAMAESIRQIVSDTAIRTHCIERGHRRAARFDWETTAQATLQVIEAAIRG